MLLALWESEAGGFQIGTHPSNLAKFCLQIKILMGWGYSSGRRPRSELVILVLPLHVCPPGEFVPCHTLLRNCPAAWKATSPTDL